MSSLCTVLLPIILTFYSWYHRFRGTAQSVYIILVMVGSDHKNKCHAVSDIILTLLGCCIKQKHNHLINF